MNYAAEMETKKVIFVLEGIVLGLLENRKSLQMNLAESASGDMGVDDALVSMIKVVENGIKDMNKKILELQNRLAND
jgi:hypothetical protein